jgi:hypothetical protein
VEVDGLSDDDHSAGPSSKVRHLGGYEDRRGDIERMRGEEDLGGNWKTNTFHSSAGGTIVRRVNSSGGG